MTQSFKILLAELEHFGKENDRATADRSRRMLNIIRDTGKFLSVLVRAMSARRVLELGTSNGYSTLWLASAARAIEGTVTSVELSDYKISLARQNLARSGIASHVTLLHEDGRNVLQRSPSGAFDFVFLDAERSEYSSWWSDLKRVLRPGGLLIVDNATSHAEEMAPFVRLLKADASFTISLVPVGNGEWLAVKSNQPLEDEHK